MREYQMMEDVLAFIEENLDQPVTVADLCNRFFVSRALLYRLFSDTFHVPLKHYIAQRRVCRAAADLVTTNQSTLDVGLKYQFQNPETFTRAFRRIFDMPPSRFRVSQAFTDLHPRKQIDTALLRGEPAPFYTPFQLSGFLSAMRKASGGYLVITDIQMFQCLNNTYGHDTGDLALAHVARRVEQSFGCKDTRLPVFRVDGDTFAVIAEDQKAAVHIARQLKEMNQFPAEVGGTADQPRLDLALPLWINILQIPFEELKESAVLALLDHVMMEARHL